MATGGENFLKICLFVLTECTNVTDDRHTDGRTDGQTPHDDIGRACIASCGKNDNSNLKVATLKTLQE